MARSSADLTPEQALIWRVVHRDNLPWILEHGLHCANGSPQDPNYVQIGLPDLIDQRKDRDVTLPPGGRLSDYVPFYFTPYSPMVYRILTGQGVTQRTREELCFLVTSLPHLARMGVAFVYADRHARLMAAKFSDDLSTLGGLPWQAWQARDFRRNPDDPEAFERYQAEALVHRHLPVGALLGVVCHDVATRDRITQLAASRHPGLSVVQRREWYL